MEVEVGLEKGESQILVPSEHELLVCLMENADTTVDFAELAQSIHGREGEDLRPRDAISTHWWRLRRKLDAAAPGKDYTISVRGRGYELVSR